MNLVNDDFKDFKLALNKYKVAYLMVGGYAVIVRGYSRTTGDIDIWVEKTEANHKRLLIAIIEFGLPDAAIPEADFLFPEFGVFTFGRPPSAIHVMTDVKGLEFTPTYQMSTIEQSNEITVRIIHLNQLKTAEPNSYARQSGALPINRSLLFGITIRYQKPWSFFQKEIRNYADWLLQLMPCLLQCQNMPKFFINGPCIN